MNQICTPQELEVMTQDDVRTVNPATLRDIRDVKVNTNLSKAQCIQDYIRQIGNPYCYTDGLEAIKQAVYKILNTERYSYIIYSWNYGIELKDLFGQAMSYVCPELERRVTEALTQDSRITAVTDFEFDTSKRGVLSTTFTVHTDLGSFEAEKEVEI